MYIIGMEKAEKEVMKCFHGHNWKPYAMELLVLAVVLMAIKFLSPLLVG